MVYKIYVHIFVDFEREKGEEREKHRSVVPLISAFTGWLYVLWWEIEPATLAYWDDALTNWATQPGLKYIFKGNYVDCNPCS